MKIKKIMLKNFANVSEIEINLRDDITYVVGENGSGKTTCFLSSVWFVLEGLSLKGKKVLHGDRFRFIGDHGKSAIGQIVLHDEAENIDITIQRKLLKNKTELKISASDKRYLPANFIDDIFNIFSINPAGFAKLNPRDQAEALGVDTSKFDQLKKEKYNERKEAGYDVKRLKGAFEELEKVSEVKSVDLQKLLQAKEKIEAENTKVVEEARTKRDEAVQEIIKYNNEQDEKNNTIEKAVTDIKTTEEKIKTLQKEINKLKISLGKHININDELIKNRNQLPTPANKKSTNIPIQMPDQAPTDAISLQIKRAEETNKKAAVYQRYIDIQGKYKTAQEKYDNKQTEMDKIESDRIKYLKSCNLPYSNITIDDAGGVLINNRPFSETYFSKGEVLRMGIKLAAAANPKLKYVFIPDSQSVDEKNREQIFKELTEAGFQVVAEYVDTEKQKNHGSILLKESQVVETYDTNEEDINML